MTGKEKAGYKDLIIKFLIENPGAYEQAHLWRELFNGKYTKDHVKEILLEMIKSTGKYIDYDGEDGYWVYVESNSFTQELINAGGYKALYNYKLKEKELQEAEKKKQYLINEIEENKIIDESIIAKRNRKYYWTPHWISGMSVIIALISLVYSFSKKKETLSSESFDLKIDSLRIEMKKEFEIMVKDNANKSKDSSITM